jgi:transcription elongation GreA/GreB family factor
MTFNSGLAGKSAKRLREEQRQRQDKRRMAFRRAIEDYREAQALQEQLGEYPEIMLGGQQNSLSRPAL